MAISMVAIKKARSLVIVALENVFYRWGRFVARRPVVVIIVSLLLSGKYMFTVILPYTNAAFIFLLTMILKMIIAISINY